jgi:hypothetical protein
MEVNLKHIYVIIITVIRPKLRTRTTNALVTLLHDIGGRMLSKLELSIQRANIFVCQMLIKYKMKT